MDGAPRLGAYRLVRRLATGGMAELFLARAPAARGSEERLAVIKRILPQYADRDELIRMFFAEARLVAALRHPNIVRVHDIGEHDGLPFFTMEYVHGQDLREIVRAARRQQRAIPLEHALHIVMGVAAGLDHVHDHRGPDGRPLGIVHRDVSPSNVLVAYAGDVKIADFGIAKATADPDTTLSGALQGKIPYVSPEQCRGEPVDRRSDVFCMGTLLWELTTGQRLFGGDNALAIMNRVAKADVPLPSAVRPGCPPQFEAIVMRALALEPDRRWASAQELRLALEGFVRQARLHVSPGRVGELVRALCPPRPS